MLEDRRTATGAEDAAVRPALEGAPIPGGVLRPAGPAGPTASTGLQGPREVRLLAPTFGPGQSWRVEDPRHAARRAAYRQAMADGAPLPMASVPDPPLSGVAAFVSAAPAAMRATKVVRPHARETFLGHLAESGWQAPDGVVMSEAARLIWDLGTAEGPALAAKYAALAALRHPADAADAADAGTGEAPGASAAGAPAEDDDDVNALVAAAALRIGVRRARHLVRDAHRALTSFPACYAQLADGRFPAGWFTRMLRDTRDLTEVARQGIDRLISSWDLRVSPERFEKRLRELVRWAEQLEEQERREQAEPPAPVERSVQIMDVGKGMSCLQVYGPAPEVASLARRLDVTARAVQAAQRAAVAAGDQEIPWDVDGLVAETGSVLRKDVLRYLLLTRAQLSADGVDIPRDRFRLVVTVPALTLLGRSEAPASLDGMTPLPADMARALAGTEDTWYRVLTDPCTGTFLPLPAQTYRPTAAMQEHLRLRHPRCAVPGCERCSSFASQCDHIEEFLDGGPTDIENLHWLCEHHHQQKTEGLLDPTRVRAAGPDAAGSWQPGTTRWLLGANRGQHVVIDERDDVDMIGAEASRWLVDHLRAHPDAPCDALCLSGARRDPLIDPADRSPGPDRDRSPDRAPEATEKRILELPAWSQHWPRLWRWLLSEDWRRLESPRILPLPPPTPPAIRCDACGHEHPAPVPAPVPIGSLARVDLTTIAEPPDGWGPQGPPPF
ncbi:HNH endonuclease signature motif containing protein [Brachybacterium hainanense]|uniref:DUF222 domain-containing protein n=1 Tax=Brachybacterium hainanense TaxID=1541174 RepID=A0ABV6R693_9MICO